MATRCGLHPGRESVATVGGVNYCKQCTDGQKAAAADLAKTNAHVEPKACFVVHAGGDKWQGLPGTGCAHWAAHRLGIKQSAASVVCIEGFPVRVKDLVAGRKTIALADIQVNDIWANLALTHNGVVTKIDRTDPAKPVIEITHDSSRQGGVRTNDFATYFGGEGKFYR